jgi:hypothetical protein
LFETVPDDELKYASKAGTLVNTPAATSPLAPIVIVFVASVPRGEIVDTFNVLMFLF